MSPIRTGDRGTFRAERAMLTLLVLLLTASILPAQPGTFKLPALEGAAGAKELTPKTFEKGVTVVVVWASWAPRCRDITTQVDALHKSWKDKASVVTVNFQEEADEIRAALASDKMPVPVYLDADGAFSKMHAVTTVPHVLVYRDGKKVVSQRLTRDIDTVIAAKLGF